MFASTFSKYSDTTSIQSLPTITNLNPDCANQNTTVTDMVITGTQFEFGALVNFDGTLLLPSSYNPVTIGTQIVVTIPGNLLATAGVVQVRVENPDGQDSNFLPFTITDVTAPTSAITNLPLTTYNIATWPGISRQKISP